MTPSFRIFCPVSWIMIPHRQIVVARPKVFLIELMERDRLRRGLVLTTELKTAGLELILSKHGTPPMTPSPMDITW